MIVDLFSIVRTPTIIIKDDRIFKVNMSFSSLTNLSMHHITSVEIKLQDILSTEQMDSDIPMEQLLSADLSKNNLLTDPHHLLPNRECPQVYFLKKYQSPYSMTAPSTIPVKIDINESFFDDGSKCWVASVEDISLQLTLLAQINILVEICHDRVRILDKSGRVVRKSSGLKKLNANISAPGWVDYLRTRIDDFNNRESISMISSNWFEWGQLQFDVQMFHDLSETVIFQQELQSVFDTAIDANVIIDENGTMVRVNPAAVKIYGYENAQDMVGKNVNILVDSTHSDNHTKYIQNYIKTGINKVIGIGREVITKRKDGSTFPADLTVSEMVIGKQRKFMGVIRNITERKEAEKKLREADKIKWEADVKVKTSTEIFACLSHELRTPLNGIIGMTTMLMDSELTEDQYQNVEILYNSSNHLLHLINNVLDFSKIDAEKLKLESISFDLYHLCLSTIELHLNSISMKKVELSLDYDPEIPVIFRGDSFRIRQVLSNLLSNATKFTQQGGISITVNRPEDSVIIEVKDTGCGMEQEQINNLFDALYQTKASVTRQFGGTGLGMNICKKLINLMKGKIEVTSQIGIGTKFVITIPLPTDSDDSSMIPSFPLARKAEILICCENELIEAFFKNIAKRLKINSAISSFKDLNQSIENIRPTHLIIEGCSANDYLTENQSFLASKEQYVLLVPSGDVKNQDFSSMEFVAIMHNRPLSTLKILRHLNLKKPNLNKSAPKRKVKDPIQSFLSETEKIAISRCKIMIVDDNSINRQVLIKTLQKMGAQSDFRMANDGLAAFEMFKADQGAYDLIFMDVLMPIMDGWEASKNIRDWERLNKRPSKVPIFMCTANHATEISEKCNSYEIQDYIVKPIEPSVLTDRLKKWVMRSDESQ